MALIFQNGRGNNTLMPCTSLGGRRAAARRTHRWSRQGQAVLPHAIVFRAKSADARRLLPPG
eukprot:6599087-Alexandrium_andersonii.AAC.1